MLPLPLPRQGGTAGYEQQLQQQGLPRYPAAAPAAVPLLSLSLRLSLTLCCPSFRSVDAVLIYLGGNDWWTLSKKRGNEELWSDWVQNYAIFLNHIRALRGPDVPIIVLACDATSGSCLSSREEQRMYSEDMQRLLGRAVSEASAGGDESVSKIFLRTVQTSGEIEHERPSDCT